MKLHSLIDFKKLNEAKFDKLFNTDNEKQIKKLKTLFQTQTLDSSEKYKLIRDKTNLGASEYLEQLAIHVLDLLFKVKEYVKENDIIVVSALYIINQYDFEKMGLVFRGMEKNDDENVIHIANEGLISAENAEGEDGIRISDKVDLKIAPKIDLGVFNSLYDSL